MLIVAALAIPPRLFPAIFPLRTWRTVHTTLRITGAWQRSLRARCSWLSVRMSTATDIHPRHRMFGFVSKDPEANTSACHVFAYDKSTAPIANAFGYARGLSLSNYFLFSSAAPASLGGFRLPPPPACFRFSPPLAFARFSLPPPHSHPPWRFQPRRAFKEAQRLLKRSAAQQQPQQQSAREAAAASGRGGARGAINGSQRR